jgi:hypothetical protein
MDDELFRAIYHRLLHSDNHADACMPGRRRSFCDAVIALVFVYAAFCGRSSRWASDKRHLPIWSRRALKLPSYSQLMRRLKTASVRWLIAQVSQELRDCLPRGGGGGSGGGGSGGGGSEKVIDAKPLTVGGFSKDPDAAVGVVPDGWARGYRVHLIVDAASAAVEAMIVTALNVAEPLVARDLVRRADLRGAVLRGDGGYDSNALYAATADAGARLIASRKKPGTGLGHSTDQHPDRLAAISQLEASPSAARVARRHRNRIEQCLAHLSNLPCGLSPLPNFVRRLWRVRLWVMGKILLYHQHLVLRAGLTPAA